MSAQPPSFVVRVALFYVGLGLMVFGGFRLSGARGLGWALMGGGFAVVLLAASISGPKKPG